MVEAMVKTLSYIVLWIGGILASAHGIVLIAIFSALGLLMLAAYQTLLRRGYIHPIHVNVTVHVDRSDD